MIKIPGEVSKGSTFLINSSKRLPPSSRATFNKCRCCHRPYNPQRDDTHSSSPLSEPVVQRACRLYPGPRRKLQPSVFFTLSVVYYLTSPLDFRSEDRDQLSVQMKLLPNPFFLILLLAKGLHWRAAASRSSNWWSLFVGVERSRRRKAKLAANG